MPTREAKISITYRRYPWEKHVYLAFIKCPCPNNLRFCTQYIISPIVFTLAWLWAYAVHLCLITLECNMPFYLLYNPINQASANHQPSPLKATSSATYMFMPNVSSCPRPCWLTRASSNKNHGLRHHFLKPLRRCWRGKLWQLWFAGDFGPIVGPSGWWRMTCYPQICVVSRKLAEYQTCE